MLFADALTLDAPKRTKDGYLAGRARVARTGLYDYAGHEVDPENAHGLRDKAVVKVFRPGDEVFDKASLASFVGKPITNDHPHDAVTADNWRKHARGTVMGAVRDGEYVGFDYLITDKATIADVEAGKRGLSNGYAVDLDFTPGTHDGVAYDAVQRAIRGNHLAIVDKGRAGSNCCLTDAATCEALPEDQRTYSADDHGGNNPSERSDASSSQDEGQPLRDGDSLMATKTILVDGLQVEVTDAAEAAITKLQGQLKDAASAKATVDAELTTAKTELAAKDTEIVTLKQAVEDAKVTPAQLRDAAKAYAVVCDKATALGVKFAEDADASTIMKAVVDAKMGDQAKDWTADQIAASFAVLAKDAKVDPLRAAITDGVRTTAAAGDRAAVNSARAAWLADKQTAHRPQVTQ